ncbi:MAG: PAS domain S-box protein [Flaviramulus sp.]|nr:PAS domain S-box protein [Flaviramulus sp.]
MEENKIKKSDNKNSKEIQEFLSSDFANLVVNTTEDAIVSTDLDGIITFWNQGSVDLFSYSKEEALGKHVSMLYREQDLPLLISKLEQVIQGGNVSSSEIIYLDKYKNEIVTLCSICGLKDENGKVYELVGITKDITKQRIALSKLKEIDFLYTSAFNVLIEGFIIQDTSLKAISANQAASDILGITLEEILNRESTDLERDSLHEDGTPFKREDHPSVKTLLTGKAYLNQIINIKSGDGNRKWISVNSQPFIENGILKYVVTTITDITLQKITDIKLKETERLFGSTINSISEGYLVLDANAKILSENKAASDILGLTMGQLVGKDAFDPRWKALHEDGSEFKPEDFPSVKSSVTGKAYYNELMNIHCGDGVRKWISINSQPVYYGKNLKYVVVTFSDITEQKISEQNLKESEQKFLKSFENSPIPVSILNFKTGKRIDVNNAFCEVFGYTKEELLSVDSFLKNNITVLEDLKKIHTKIYKVGFLNNHPSRMITKSGEIRDVLYSATKLYPDNDDIFIGASLDITELKNTQEELKESLSKNELAIESAELGVWEYDTSSNYLSWNDKQLEFYGIKRTEFKNSLKQWFEFVHPDDVDYIDKCIKSILVDFKKRNNIDFRIIRQGGEIRYLNGSATPIVVDDVLVKLIGVVKDVTSVKIAEDELREVLSQNRLAIEMAKLGVWEFSFETGQLTWNDTHLEFYGITRNEFNMDLNAWRTQVHPDDIEYADKRFADAFESNKTIQGIEFRIFRPNGELRYLSGSATPVFNNGVRVKLIGIVNDITDEKLRIEKIRISEVRYRTLFETARDALFLVDQEIVVDVNLSTTKLFGFKYSSEIIGRKIWEFAPQNQSNGIITEEAVKSIYESLTEGREVSEIFTLTKKDGSEFLAEVRLNNFFHNGQSSILTIVRDVTEKIATENELKAAFEEIKGLKQELEAENLYLKQELKLDNNFEEIIGSSTSLKKILKQVEQVAKTDSTVLILGETGTGKELIAKAIHKASDRANKPLVKVNCASLPSELIESELFGHEKGSFTGAINKKIGRFELADGGTIFLDEIGELPIDMQTRLLRVLQENEFERVGGEKTIKVDVRVLAATNRDLVKFVSDGKFRQDLYYRLNVFPITCPPLRNRQDDIPDLVNHFITKYNHKVQGKIKSVGSLIIEKLLKYKWPGNIRELEHVIERAVIVSVGSKLQIGSWFLDNSVELPLDDKFKTLEAFEKEYILKVLTETNWKIRGKNGASEILGMKPTTLESRIKKLEIAKKN